MIIAVTIIASVLGLGLVIAIAWFARRPRKLVLRPARQPVVQSAPVLEPVEGHVVLRYSSGTTVVLDDASEYQRRTAAGSVVSPMPRRRLPGVMATAGHVVAPKPSPARDLHRSESFDVFDEN